ncbi:MAG: hydrogenase iron-sulfur subunit [Proteobacteria bacterium]|nr:hydrogenase iron-sulfur subunit [Desulfobacula sp.]MBU3951671.1 hydrogenase iron-sulfur subunit [Pseudomonadota bacterium]MBU4132837.1 hydrogenase iron-sulfur subunit [Pseudomonadota bacterium]
MIQAGQQPKITVFHCLNSFRETPQLFEGCQANIVKMACSSMTQDIYLLKAFEAGADAVIVLVCPEQACRYAEGSIRAKKRVTRVKALLDEIGLDGERLSLFNTMAEESVALRHIIQTTLVKLDTIGLNPAFNHYN